MTCNPASAIFLLGLVHSGIAHGLDFDQFVVRAEHCFRNILTYRDAPHAMKNRFPIITGRMATVLRSMKQRNMPKKMETFYSYAHLLRENFDEVFKRCVEEPCSEPPEPGRCMHQLTMYYYDPLMEDCRQFTYTGCDRNFNIFTSRLRCMAVCAGVELNPEQRRGKY